MHMYMFGPNFWQWVVVGAVVIMLLRRRRHRRRWGWSRWEDRVGWGRRGRSGRGGEETPWWRDDPHPADVGPEATAGAAGGERGDGAGEAAGKASSPRQLPEQTLESLKREYVEGRMGVEEYERELDALYARRRRG